MKQRTQKVLFILKQKENSTPNDDNYSDNNYSWEYSSQGLTTGLLNSATYVSEMLSTVKGIESDIVIVKDNNEIDRVVANYKPDFVIIEALWVVPSKLELLTKFHPKVKWIVRLHSELPFIANEGIAFQWIAGYFNLDRVTVAVNSLRMERELEFYFKTIGGIEDVKDEIIYLPNYYPNRFKDKEFDKAKDTIEIACFGAIRPLKNHLIQAFAAIMFAEKIGKKLNFHINTSRVEQNGSSVLKNLESLFDSISGKGGGHKLVKHGWYKKETFLTVCSTMDLGMQVSLSETFNLVTADLISQGIPVVTSKEIQWVDKSSQVDPNDSQNIAKTLEAIYRNSKKNASVNKRYLRNFSEVSKKIWVLYLNKL